MLHCTGFATSLQHTSAYVNSLENVVNFLFIEFSSVGNYQLNYSLSANFLSKTLEFPVTPYFHARAEGLMRVGSTVFALVETRGTLLEILLPLTLEQNFSQWPLLARCVVKENFFYSLR